MKIESKKMYRLGTRKSLLAIAQSSWVARSLEALNPGIKIELVGIETKGDVVLDKPLSQIEGKEFFTAELDWALMRGDVDLTVHSMKDLSLERPPELKLAATPTREFAHDILLFHETVVERLQSGLPIRIGTSSPRRLSLIPKFLEKALPKFDGAPPLVLEFVQIRGNVNSRLSRVHEDEQSPRKLDAVVLAFAGLERLALDEKASIELNGLLKHTRLMVVPLNICPSAPAQGALAVEAKTSDAETLQMISKLHDASTLKAVERERAVLSAWGGGCHQQLGASSLPNGKLSVLGVKPSGEWVDETRDLTSTLGQGFVKIDAHDVFDFKPRELTASERERLETFTQVFVAHARAVEHLNSATFLQHKRVWVSGASTWFKLAAMGIWVEGSLEGQGYQVMTNYQAKKLLRLEPSFAFLTHAESEPTPATEHFPTYQHVFREIPEKIHAASKIFWSSGLPFQTLWSKLGPEFLLKKEHASGPGKTADLLKTTLNSHGVK